MDQLIENQNIAALGIQSDMLLKGEVIDSWSPHIVTLTGRRWNDEKNNVNLGLLTAGESLAHKFQILRLNVIMLNELWVSEFLLLQYGNSLTTISDSPMIKARWIRITRTSILIFDCFSPL